MQHKGNIDATAALDWTFANYPRLTDVVVTVRSAGAISGSILLRADGGTALPQRALHAVRRRGHRRDQLGGGGFDVWGVRNRRAAPDQFVASLYASAARNYPRAGFGEYTTYNDNTQINYYTMMGTEIAWTLGMGARIDSLTRYANFSAYVAPGGEHCITPTPRFYSEAVNGVRFRDWFAALVSGQRVSTRCVER
ncbi:MAG: hypothetical protein U0703_06900 [Anaerolineae bacterium]